MINKNLLQHGSSRVPLQRCRFAECLALTVWLICYGEDTWAQSVCLPAPRLLTTLPMGAQVGSKVELVVSGDALDEAGPLIFSHPGITAENKVNAQGQPEPHRFVVQIADHTPSGVYEARVMTRLGLSTPRAFTVSNLKELIREQPNTTLASAMELPVDCICNAVMSPRAVDHYVIQAASQQTIVIDCAARGIDSKLQPVAIIADAAGRDLLVERRGGRLEFTVPESGRYVIKVHDLSFQGGAGYFYRLAVQSKEPGKSLPRPPSTRSVSSFSWPPAGLSAESTVLEHNTGVNNEVQTIDLPCDVTGSFYPAADVDRYEFEAQQGDVWWVEVASERLGWPTDPSIVIQRVEGRGESEKIADLIELTDLPSPMKPSSNGYAYDGPPYDAGSTDILGKLEIPATGRYRLLIRDLFGGTRNEPQNAYRLVIRRATPDFAVVGWGLHMELRNGDRNALSKPISLRRGATMALEVVAVRRDGFDGEIELVMEDLPEGVTAQGLTIPAGKQRGMLLLTAAETAPRGLTFAKFYGQATIVGTVVRRPGSIASMAWPVADAWSEIPSPRLLADIPVSISDVEPAPMSLRAQSPAEFEGTVGQTLTIPLQQVRRCEFSGATMQLKAMGGGFEAAPAFEVSLQDKAESTASQVSLDLSKLKIPPGDYWIAFYGGAVAKYEPAVAPLPRGDTAKKDTEPTKPRSTKDIVDIVVSEPIAIHIKPANPK